MNTKKTSIYEICVAEHLSRNCKMWFEGFNIRTEFTPDGNPITVFTGAVDQSGLHGIFYRIQNLGLTLLSVNRR